MANDDVTQQKTRARGAAMDRLNQRRNNLVRVIQEHPDPEIREKARARLAALPKFDPQRAGAMGDFDASPELPPQIPDTDTGESPGLYFGAGDPNEFAPFHGNQHYSNPFTGRRERSSPGPAQTTKALGIALGGIGGIGAGALMRGALPKATSAAGKIATGMATGGVEGATQDAVTNLAAGDTENMGGRALASGLVGLGFGGLAGALEINKWIGLRSRGEEIDKARQQATSNSAARLDLHMPQRNPAPSGGIDDAMRAGQRGTQGVIDEAQAGSKRMFARQGEKSAASLAERKQRLAGLGLNRPVDVDSLLASLDEGVTRYDVSGMPVSDEAAGVVSDIRKRLTPSADDVALAEMMGASPKRATARDLLEARGSVREAADFDAREVTPAARGARKVYGQIRGKVQEAIPGLKEADDASTDALRQERRFNDIMTGNQAGMRPANVADIGDAEEVVGRVADEITAADRVALIGDRSIPAMKRVKYLDELKAMDPEFSAELDRVEMRKALEATKLRNTLDNPVRGSLSQSVPIAGTSLPIGHLLRSLGGHAQRTALPAATRTVPMLSNPLDAILFRRQQQEQNK